jgi:Rieske Fe-S protein
VSGLFPCPTDCPGLAGPVGGRPFDFPVGQVHRVASVNGEEVDETKRNLLKLAAVAGVLGVGVGGAVGGLLKYVQPPIVGLTSYPRTQLVDVGGSPLTLTQVGKEYSSGTSDLYLFNYPLTDEPNFLLNLYPAASNVPGAIVPPSPMVSPPGTDNSVVAYSAICQHLGCPAPAISYYPPATCKNKSFSTAAFPNGTLNFYIHCSCHGSTYDVTNGAANLTGPAILPLPQVILEVDSDYNIFATGMTSSSPPVKDHVKTLDGGYGVGGSSQLSKESPVILCTFPSS